MCNKYTGTNPGNKSDCTLYCLIGMYCTLLCIVYHQLALKNQVVIRFNRSYFDTAECAIIELHILYFNIVQNCTHIDDYDTQRVNYVRVNTTRQLVTLINHDHG